MRGIVVAVKLWDALPSTRFTYHSVQFDSIWLHRSVLIEKQPNLYTNKFFPPATLIRFVFRCGYFKCHCCAHCCWVWVELSWVAREMIGLSLMFYRTWTRAHRIIDDHKTCSGIIIKIKFNYTFSRWQLHLGTSHWQGVVNNPKIELLERHVT